jgi:hypothetical protein
VTDVDRTTYEYVNGEVKSGAKCSNERCGMTYRRCTEKLYAGNGAPCCKRCALTDTHGERAELPPATVPVQKAVTLGVDGQTVGPLVMEASNVDRLLEWHADGQRGRNSHLTLGQLPTRPEDDTIRLVSLSLGRGHVGYIQVEAVRYV